MALLIYFIGLVIIGIFGAVALYHSRKYRCPGDLTRAASILYLVAFALIVVASFVLIGSTDFSGAE